MAVYAASSTLFSTGNLPSSGIVQKFAAFLFFSKGKTYETKLV
jgi:hypothetical protein